MAENAIDNEYSLMSTLKQLKDVRVTLQINGSIKIRFQQPLLRNNFKIIYLFSLPGDFSSFISIFPLLE